MFTDLTNQILELAGLPPTTLGDEPLLLSWKDALDLETSGSWTAAVLRITGYDKTTGYHAVGYTDINALLPCLKAFAPFPEEFSEELIDTLTVQKFSRNPVVWRALKSMTKLITDTQEDFTVHVPDVDEIRTNIADFRASKLVAAAQPTLANIPEPEITDTNASIPKAVRQVFTNLIKEVSADSTAGKKFVAYTKTMTGEFILAKLQELHATYGEDFEEACDNSDTGYLCDTVDWSPLFADEKRRNYFVTKIDQADDEQLKRIRTQLNHMNSFTRVQGHLPTGMMSKIEEYTSGLLTKLKNKEMKFSDLNIEEIGRDVVESSAEADVDAMGENINELIPVIQRSGLFDQIMKQHMS